VVALVACVLAGGLAQLVVQRVIDLGETGVIAGAEVEGERVRDDAPALHIDAAVVVHLAQQPAAELDGADAATGGTREHDLDHIL
jgi:hypothetical protein